MRSDSGLLVGWPTLVIGLTVLTLASLGTLVVIVGIKDVDILSTVALALAVLSFAAQLIVTMAQSQQTSQVKTETLSALAEMRATTESLLSNQRHQFDTVLKAALSQAIPAAVQDLQLGEEGTDGDSSSDRQQELVTALQNRIEQSLARPATVDATMFDFRAQPQRRRARYDKLYEWPSREDGLKAQEILRSLEPREIARFGDIVSDWPVSIRGDGGVVRNPRGRSLEQATKALIEAGLLTADHPDGESGRRIYQLTDLGVAVAQLLWARGEPPEWLAS